MQECTMSSAEIDDYLAALDQPKRATLEQLRATIRSIVPDAEERIAYGCPAFKFHGKVVAGFAAFKNHLSYLPHSGSVLGAVSDDLAGYTMTKSALHFPVDTPLPADLVRTLIDVRLREIDGSK